MLLLHICQTASLVFPHWTHLLQAGVLERRLFYMPSFKIYGSVAGFYDYGPPGCAVKQYITQYWRQHFILEEDMLQVHISACIFSSALYVNRMHIQSTRAILGLVLAKCRHAVTVDLRCDIQRLAHLKNFALTRVNKAV